MLMYLASEKDFWKEKRVIELGAGTGIVGIGVAALGNKTSWSFPIQKVLTLL